MRQQLVSTKWFVAALQADADLGRELIRSMHARLPEAAGNWANQSAWLQLTGTAAGIVLMQTLVSTNWFVAALQSDADVGPELILSMISTRPENTAT